MTRVLHIFMLWISTSIPAIARDVDTALANEFCPVIADERVDPDISVEYEGKRVYLCCAMCRKQFLENPTAYLANLPQFSSMSAGDEEAAEEHTHGVEGATASEEVGHDREETHDHAASHGEQIEGVWRAVRFLGRFHPVVVHFPVALVVAAAIAEILAFLTRKSLFADAARFSVIFGAAGAVIAVSLGWAAGAFAHHPGDLAWVLTKHRWLGTGTGILIVIVAFLSEQYRRRPSDRFLFAYRITLFAAMVLVGVTGHLGGTLIYGPGYYTW